MWSFLRSHAGELGQRLAEHLAMSLTATLVAIVLGALLGAMAVRSKSVRGAVLSAASLVQTVPSLALLTLMLPLFGIGTKPAIIALTLYALLPIVRNTYAGLSAVPASMLEMSDALGLSRSQRMAWVEARFALPFVIAGVRTAAVVSVGITTLSAFIGAGGLGVFINRGLALNNMDLLLLGAVPAGLLALYIDFLLATVERAFKPLADRRQVTLQFAAAVAVAVVMFAGMRSVAAPTTSTASRVGIVVVGSKNFTEQLVLGQMIAILIEERTGLRAVRKLNLAGTAVCQKALEDGSIDLYVEYTGTALTSVLGMQTPSDAEVAWSTVRREYRERFGIEWLPKLGFANTYALALRREQAERSDWKKVSDLRPEAESLSAGFTAEFMERKDGYPGLSALYGFKFGTALDMDPGLMYDALREGEVDVVSAFSTDGRIAAYDLALLIDDKLFFPPYDAAIVVRRQTLEKYSGLREVLEELSGRLDEATMQRLNLAVDGEKRTPRDVAREFLEREGLVGG